MNKIRSFLLIAFTFLFVNVFSQNTSIKTEMRAVWVATVDNIDWPDAPSLNAQFHKDAFLRLLETHFCNGINTIIVQVRPSSDAFYPSPYEPWSQWLTGIQGQAPEPFFDPLDFMIKETHKRGMEFHAWINPFRAVQNTEKSSIAQNHITKQHPDWFIKYGGKLFFDPGNKEARKYVVEVVKDIVNRYPIDAVHIDDYFYPYPLPGIKFQDEKTYALYGNSMKVDDWRRSNVDSVIENLYTSIKKINKDCQFGVSPFGVWRNADRDPRGSKTQAGPTDYDFLYADILLWLKMGWVDYIAPQLYWEMSSKRVPFDVVLDWWSKNSNGKKCYIGLGVYRAGSNKAWCDKNLLPKQIHKIRNTPNVHGMMFYSSRSLEKNLNGWSDSLRLNYFKEPAMTPKMKAP